MGRVVRGKEKRKVGRWWSGGREMDRRGGGKEAERKVEGKEKGGWVDGCGRGGRGVVTSTTPFAIPSMKLWPAQHLLQVYARHGA